ncbi:hypothetical protein OFR29_08565 [Brachyspira hyodysenteriae]|nr:hypothetical protein [Brachyspira hyodysenteriae]MCZ9892336.1 hypothetical protein [Brachyspira hyodysenteriae]MCZ9989883.1 hypothetical protein [Brachyspira hyodysenteriae]MDA0029520.1 hypothetical protein [Brachyspira hyodysenteriae]
MKVGKLIHTITFYTTKYIDNGNGTGSNELIELRKVKCSIEDITYKDIQQGKRKFRKNFESAYSLFQRV